MTDQKTALVLFSGGQDSCTCLAHALARYERVETVGFTYGQTHSVEMRTRKVFLAAWREAFAEQSARLGPDHQVDLSGYGEIAQSTLTGSARSARRKDGLPETYVPGRNLIFLIAAAALAERRDCQVLIGGMCETDYSGYPDCRREALDAIEQAIQIGMQLDLQVETPLMYLTKAQSWELAQRLGGDRLIALIVEHSHSCYEGNREHRHAWGYGCGACDACTLRAKGHAVWLAGT